MGLFAKVGHGKLLISLAGVTPPRHHLSHGCVSSSMVLRWTVLSPACQKKPRLLGVTTIWYSHSCSLKRAEDWVC